MLEVRLAIMMLKLCSNMLQTVLGDGDPRGSLSA